MRRFAKFNAHQFFPLYGTHFPELTTTWTNSVERRYSQPWQIRIARVLVGEDGVRNHGWPLRILRYAIRLV